MSIVGQVTPLESSLEAAGPLEMAEEVALELAFQNRRDLMVATGRVADAMRFVVVDADALRAGLNIVLNGSAGESRGLGSAEADSSPNHGRSAEGIANLLPGGPGESPFSTVLSARNLGSASRRTSMPPPEPPGRR